MHCNWFAFFPRIFTLAHCLNAMAFVKLWCHDPWQIMHAGSNLLFIFLKPAKNANCSRAFFVQFRVAHRWSTFALIPFLFIFPFHSFSSYLLFFCSFPIISVSIINLRPRVTRWRLFSNAFSRPLSSLHPQGAFHSQLGFEILSRAFCFLQ